MKRNDLFNANDLKLLIGDERFEEVNELLNCNNRFGAVLIGRNFFDIILHLDENGNRLYEVNINNVKVYPIGTVFTDEDVRDGIELKENLRNKDLEVIGYGYMFGSIFYEVKTIEDEIYTLAIDVFK